MRILVTGATSEFGSKLMEYFSNRSDFTFVPSHSTVPYFRLEDEMPSDYCVGYQAIIHLAFARSPKINQTLKEINKLGTSRLLEQAINSKVKHFILISSDSASENALSTYGQTKYEAETIVLSSDIGTVLRVGLIGGASPLGPFQKILKLAETLKFLPLPRPDFPNFTLTSIEEVGAVLLKVLNSLPVGGPFAVSGIKRAVTLREAISFSLKTSVLIVPLPIGLGLTSLVFKTAKLLKINLPLSQDSVTAIFVKREIISFL